MRVFVAGAAGAVGQQLLPQLNAAGHQVSGL
jgi:nucleoside-diphosphate-sugar epimerase